MSFLHNSSLGLVDSPGKKSSSSPRVLSILSSVLERSIQKNESSSKASKKKEVVTIFHCLQAPSLSIRQYIERIFKYSRCSPSCFVVAYIYLDRFLQQINGCLTRLNVHRLLITSFLVAAKFVDDECYNNAYYAKIGGISTAEMNKLELNFLFTLEFKLHVTTEVFAKYCSQLDMEGAAGEESWVSPIIEALGTKLRRLNRDGKT
ncbi:Cyclin-P3-1 [Citrus sinensis]|nr:cyclin-P3-1-like [Citrus sinensis]KAH9689197.1 Cyclin-P3-1 [Citrus sinensis]